mmetsp:Transcript_103667/g.299865  ORF Transcript_103667/g.299865 Transcript_103667/m.299865 type:complete len:336 (-) Transcript_103667:229-1236(-)
MVQRAQLLLNGQAPFQHRGGETLGIGQARCTLADGLHASRLEVLQDKRRTLHGHLGHCARGPHASADHNALITREDIHRIRYVGDLREKPLGHIVAVQQACHAQEFIRLGPALDAPGGGELQHVQSGPDLRRGAGDVVHEVGFPWRAVASHLLNGIPPQILRRLQQLCELQAVLPCGRVSRFQNGADCLCERLPQPRQVLNGLRRCGLHLHAVRQRKHSHTHVQYEPDADRDASVDDHRHGRLPPLIRTLMPQLRDAISRQQASDTGRLRHLEIRNHSANDPCEGDSADGNVRTHIAPRERRVHQLAEDVSQDHALQPHHRLRNGRAGEAGEEDG